MGVEDLLMQIERLYYYCMTTIIELFAMLYCYSTFKGRLLPQNKGHSSGGHLVPKGLLEGTIMTKRQLVRTSWFRDRKVLVANDKL